MGASRVAWPLAEAAWTVFETVRSDRHSRLFGHGLASETHGNTDTPTGDRGDRTATTAKWLLGGHNL
jgi:hypothetical protein